MTAGSPVTDEEVKEWLIAHYVGTPVYVIAEQSNRDERTISAHLSAMGISLRRGPRAKVTCPAGHKYADYGRPLFRKSTSGTGLVSNGRDCQACKAIVKGQPVPSVPTAREVAKRRVLAALARGLNTRAPHSIHPEGTPAP